MDILIHCFCTLLTMAHYYRPLPGYQWLARSMYNCYHCSIGWYSKHISDLFPILSNWLKCCFLLFLHPACYGALRERLGRFSGWSICMYNCYYWSMGLCQCVTIPKIWTKPNPKLFSDTKFFRYRIRYFFRYQIFSDTDTDTFFWNQKFLKPIPIPSQQLE